MNNVEYCLSLPILVDIETIENLKFPLGSNHKVVEHLRLTTVMSSGEAEEYLMTIHDLCMRLSTVAVRGKTAGENLRKYFTCSICGKDASLSDHIGFNIGEETLCNDCHRKNATLK